MQKTQVWSLSWEDPLEEEIATQSSVLAGNRGDGGLQSIGLQSTGQHWAHRHHTLGGRAAWSFCRSFWFPKSYHSSFCLTLFIKESEYAEHCVWKKEREENSVPKFKLMLKVTGNFLACLEERHPVVRCRQEQGFVLPFCVEWISCLCRHQSKPMPFQPICAPRGH